MYVQKLTSRYSPISAEKSVRDLCVPFNSRHRLKKKLNNYAIGQSGSFSSKRIFSRAKGNHTDDYSGVLLLDTHIVQHKYTKFHYNI